MKKYWVLIVFVTLLTACSGDEQNNKTEVSPKDSMASAQKQVADPLVMRDRISPEEKRFFKGLAARYRLTVSDSVIRYYNYRNGQKENVLNTFIYPADGLIDDAYIYYNMSFTPLKDDPHINFDYSAGTASTGSGTITCFGKTVLYSERSCGTSACITTIMQDGDTVYTKTDTL